MPCNDALAGDRARTPLLSRLLYALTAAASLACLLAKPLTLLPVVVAGESLSLACWSHRFFPAMRLPCVIALSLLFVCSMVRRVIDGRVSRPYSLGMKLLFSGVLLAPAACMVWLLDRLPAMLTTNFILLSVVGAVTVAVWHVFEKANLDHVRPGRVMIFIFLVSTLAYTAVGLRLTRITGEHVGDESHYLVQAQSLYEDGDVDIKNNLQDKVMVARAETSPDVRLKHFHIAPNSRNGKWYSWHPLGLPLLMALIWPLGVWARYLLLGSIGALGNVGTYMLCRRFGAEPRVALLAMLGLAVSAYWTLYAARALPEMLGAVMLVWIMLWATQTRTRDPGLVLAMALLLVGLPFVHERFAPFCVLGILTFMGGLWMDRELRPVRKIAFTVIPAVVGTFGLIVYGVVQFMMFEKGIKVSDASTLFFSYPRGIIGILCSDRGILTVLPVFAWLFAAVLIWPFLRGPDRFFRIMLTLCFLVAWIIWGSNIFYTGGSCVPGRYLLIVIPLMMPAAGTMLQRASSLGRFCFLFLAVWSATLLALVLIHLPEMGRKFILPIPALSALPEFRSILYPFAAMADGPWSASMSLSVVFGLLLVEGCLLLMFRRRTLWMLVLIALPVMLIVAIKAQSLAPSPALSPESTAHWLARRTDRPHMVVTGLSKPCRLYDFSHEFFADAHDGNPAWIVTTKSGNLDATNHVLSLPQIAINDWAGRGWRWATLTAPKPTVAGPQCIHIGGVVNEGTARPVVAVREGDITHEERQLLLADDGTWSGDMMFDARGKGDLYVLLTLSQGTGAVTVTNLWRTPVVPDLIRTGLLTTK